MPHPQARNPLNPNSSPSHYLLSQATQAIIEPFWSQSGETDPNFFLSMKMTSSICIVIIAVTMMGATLNSCAAQAVDQPIFPNNGLCFGNGQPGFCVPQNVCRQAGITPVQTLFCPTVAPCCPGVRPTPCGAVVNGAPKNGTCLTTLTCALAQKTSAPSPACGNAPFFVQCCV